MAYFRDLSTDEIDEVPERSPAMVKREWHKARAFLLDARWDGRGAAPAVPVSMTAGRGKWRLQEIFRIIPQPQQFCASTMPIMELPIKAP